MITYLISKGAGNMNYLYKDKNGIGIREGMKIAHKDEKKPELVYACGDNDLGINASNEKFLEIHNTDREFYPLCIFDLKDWEIVEVTPEHLKQIALDLYNEGGDLIYECWDMKDYEEHVTEYGKNSIKELRKIIKLKDDYRKEIEATAF